MELTGNVSLYARLPSIRGRTIVNHSKARRFPWRNTNDNRSIRRRRPVPLFVILAIALLGATMCCWQCAHRRARQQRFHHREQPYSQPQLFRRARQAHSCRRTKRRLLRTGISFLSRSGPKTHPIRFAKNPRARLRCLSWIRWKVVTSVAGLDKGKSESATMAAIWLAIGDQTA